MFSLEGLGRWLILLGVSIAMLGVLFWLLSRVPFFNQLGSLPGDIHFRSADGRFSCWIPIVSSILLSIILTILLNIVVRLFNR
ncbi:MAG: DUF2905 family protein [Anaerolineae bacterium]